MTRFLEKNDNFIEIQNQSLQVSGMTDSAMNVHQESIGPDGSIIQAMNSEKRASRVDNNLRRLSQMHNNMFSTHIDILDQVSQRTAEMIH